MDSKSLISGLFAGLMAGSIASLLSAPASGDETRQYMKQYNWKNVNRLLSRKGQAAVYDWRYAATEGLEAVDGLTQEMKKTYSRYKQEVEPEMESIQEQIKEISDSITELNERIRKESE
ncbi:YtxH domain-containing protein [Salibacterium qingdaonense]|uniref:Gas vesicle protein n=1 Tax=Salibacterium qingdaonense TaxID=266892 RepID=A0A1I4JB64_9BACI|nr:YtxH domain-containing protein [Salibacterium qingdaonense]SFL63809.1 Gas vesicle protein [Salibacterium qingdaonense]